MQKLVSKKELKTVFGIPYSPAHIARLEAVGKFPKRVQFGASRVAWLSEEVQAWLDELVRVRDSGTDEKNKDDGKPWRPKVIRATE